MGVCCWPRRRAIAVKGILGVGGSPGDGEEEKFNKFFAYTHHWLPVIDVSFGRSCYPSTSEEQQSTNQSEWVSACTRDWEETSG